MEGTEALKVNAEGLTTSSLKILRALLELKLGGNLEKYYSSAIKALAALQR